MALLPLALLLVGTAQVTGAPVAPNSGPGKGFPMHMKLERTVNVRQMISLPRLNGPTRQTRVVRLPEPDAKHSLESKAAAPLLAMLGGANSPPSSVSNAGSNSQGFDGVSLATSARAGSGKYSGTNGDLEPPDQALCVGSGFVMEGVNQSWQIFTTRSVPLTPPIPIVQLFQLPPATNLPNSAFVSDPRCLYDAATKRWFAITLEIDEDAPAHFARSHNYVAVSKTSDPTGDWYIYSFDVTNDGIQGTPMHLTCPCLGDQPLLGADANGFYLSTNEFSDNEVLPVALPPGANGPANTIFTLPDFRNGQAQVYAYSKAQMVAGGQSVNGETWDTGDGSYPLPPGAPTTGAVWSSLQPAHSPSHDNSPVLKNGTEFFLSSIDFTGSGAKKIAVWALINSASLNTTPSLTLKNTLLDTSDTYQSTPPDASPFAADQKDGSHPLADSCSPTACALERLNANDDRMNEVMLTNGVLYGGLNTVLPQINPAGTGTDLHYRVGIMYFEVLPGFDGNALNAQMLRDGYVNVPRENVLFPSIGTTTFGTVIMGFTLSGVDYYPSAAWTRLTDAPGNLQTRGPKVNQTPGPVVYVSKRGGGPEDGFTGYCQVQGQLYAGDPLGQCTDGVSRWGDYTYTEVDEQGCVWTAAEYTPGDVRTTNANWGSFITRIKLGECNPPDFTTRTVPLNINPCVPLWSDPSADDQTNAILTNVPNQGMNPQLDIVQGDITFSADGLFMSTILTIRNLSTTLPPGGQANNYYFYWTFGNTKYITLASVDATGIATFSDGTWPAGGFRTFRTGAPADTGQFIPGPNGKVIVTVPVSVLGNPHKGQLLLSPNGETREVEERVVLGYDDDTTVQSYDYLIGSVCTQSAKTQTTVTRLGTPNTSAGSASLRLLPFSLIALGLGFLLLRLRKRPT